MGSTGLGHVASLNRDKAEYLKAGLLAAGFRPLFDGPTFNEFALVAPEGFEKTWRRLQEQRKVLFGLKLDGYASAYLFCATETRSRAEIDSILEEISR